MVKRRGVCLCWCDHNFIFYWLNERTFPKVQNIYLNSNPSSPKVLRRKFSCIHLHEKFENVLQNSDMRNMNVRIISKKKYDELIDRYENEDMIYKVLNE